MRELLIMGVPHEYFKDSSIEAIRAAAEPEFHVTALPADADSEARCAAIEAAEVVVGEPKVEELQYAKKLKWLQLTWAGADRYTAEAERFPKETVLTCATGAYGITIAEHVMGMLFALCRHIPGYLCDQRIGKHRMLRPEKCVYGGTAVILGVGDIGWNVAKRLKACGMKTVGVCRTLRELPAEFDEAATLETVDLTKADVIVGCLPGTKETRGWLSRERLASLKSDAVIINIGRGYLIDCEALTELLQSGHLFGAGLDVTDPEPLPEEHPLRHMTNVIVTPHVAGVGLGGAPITEQLITEICCANIGRYLRGETLENRIDFATGYKRR